MTNWHLIPPEPDGYLQYSRIKSERRFYKKQKRRCAEFWIKFKEFKSSLDLKPEEFTIASRHTVGFGTLSPIDSDTLKKENS